MKIKIPFAPSRLESGVKMSNIRGLIPNSRINTNEDIDVVDVLKIPRRDTGECILIFICRKIIEAAGQVVGIQVVRKGPKVLKNLKVI